MSFPLSPQAAVVNFSIFETESKSCLAAAGLSVYLQKQAHEFNGLSKNQIKKIIIERFNLSESITDKALSIIEKTASVKFSYSEPQKGLTNAPDGIRLKNVVTQTPERTQPQLHYVLNESSFDKSSPLYEIKEIIIDWWNNHKSGVKSLTSWNLQKTEFKKIYNDESVNQNVDAIVEIVERAISSSVDGGRKWMGIKYNNWVEYNKHKWQERNKRNKIKSSQNGEIIVPESGGPWLQKLKIPTN